jgi:hypothetical protein
MATKVYESIELELQDGTVVTVKPLNLKTLRLVMKEWQNAQNVTNEDEFLEVLIKCTSIAMKHLAPEKADSVEEDLDLQTMYKILEISADIRLNDPNLVAAAQGQPGRN